MSETSNGPTQEPMTAEQFNHHGVDFRILKLNPLAAHQVMEYVRPALFQAPMTGVNRGLASLFGNPAVLNMIDPKGGIPRDMAGVMSGLVDVVLTLDPIIIERLRLDLFDQTLFRAPNMSDYEKLGGAEDDAFASLPRGAIYTMIARSFIVNFSDFLPEILSLIPGLGSLKA